MPQTFRESLNVITSVFASYGLILWSLFQGLKVKCICSSTLIYPHVYIISLLALWVVHCEKMQCPIWVIICHVANYTVYSVLFMCSFCNLSLKITPNSVLRNLVNGFRSSFAVISHRPYFNSKIKISLVLKFRSVNKYLFTFWF